MTVETLSATCHVDAPRLTDEDVARVEKVVLRMSDQGPADAQWNFWATWCLLYGETPVPDLAGASIRLWVNSTTTRGT